MAKATEGRALLEWYSREVPSLLEHEKLFDPEGIFIGDASYVFVRGELFYFVAMHLGPGKDREKSVNSR